MVDTALVAGRPLAVTGELAPAWDHPFPRHAQERRCGTKTLASTHQVRV